jgi:hypothetical protein
MLYDKYKRAKPLMRSNQPIILYPSYEQRIKTIQYNSNNCEDVNEVAKLFRSTFMKHFEKKEFKKKEDEVVKGFQSLSVQLEVNLSALTEEEQEQLKEKHYVIKKEWTINKSKLY